ncbi:AGC family protein kinase [Histomonas meleagridis]|uniref:AGC family protein kinase n=1 Tax=Histomonas meleagridis TaxID=135588 RepID=UPI00355951C5|nr:AGC family protein kinase [Histomonas meleagridis]KAH0804420.1 AGC family protein kinase [Histomonas meleagridis]
MEYCPGGDLYSLLQNIGCCQDENVAKFYTAEVVEALEFLRESNVIHRDLKPNNILVSEIGHLKLADFGLSVWGLVDRQCAFEESPERIMGTPDYIAPEIILQQSHTFTADYWSLGCILFEMLTGAPPFHRETVADTFTQILKGEYDVSELNDNSDEAKDLIAKLLNKDPAERLGASSIREIKNHPWFASIDWDNLQEQEPPFVPSLESELDTSFFEEKEPPEQDFSTDIEEDIKYASNSKAQKRALSFFEDLSDQYSMKGSVDEEDDLLGFPSASPEALSRVTRRAAKKKRSSSMILDDKLPEPAPLHESYLLMESHSFSAATVQTGRPKSRKRPQ